MRDYVVTFGPMLIGFAVSPALSFGICRALERLSR